jgi:hypothetical protein
MLGMSVSLPCLNVIKNTCLNVIKNICALQPAIAPAACTCDTYFGPICADTKARLAQISDYLPMVAGAQWWRGGLQVVDLRVAIR